MSEKEFDPDNPFYKALKDRQFPKKPEAPPAADTPAGELTAQSPADEVMIDRSTHDQATGQPEEVLAEYDLSPGDQALFLELVELINKYYDSIKMDRRFRLSPHGRGSGVNTFWRIRDLFRDSHRHDVSFQLNRWLGSHQDDPRIREVSQQILFRGYRAEAVRSLKSLTPENMKYGPKGQTVEEKRRERIERAQEYAKKAGVSVEELAKEHGLECYLVESI